MTGYKRQYITGKFVCVIIEIVGWAMVIIGLGLSYWGLVSDGKILALSPYLTELAPIIVRGVSGLIGIVAVATGLLQIMSAQRTMATIDTSLMTQKLLELELAKEVYHP